MAKFSFYSTEIDPTTDPENANPQPATIVVLNRDPLVGEYDQQAGSNTRGSFIPTLGGGVLQEFTSQEEDQRIKISDRDALTQANIDTLKTMESSGEWYFTDGYDVWKTKFMKPRGFSYRRNVLIANSGKTIYSYDIDLITTWKSGES